MRGLGIFCYPPENDDTIAPCTADYGTILADRRDKEDTESGAWFLNYLVVKKMKRTS